jgi:glucan 1,3-beta-glucosidase
MPGNAGRCEKLHRFTEIDAYLKNRTFDTAKFDELYERFLRENPDVANRFGNKSETKIRGVHLGGWLVLEKPFVPHLFEGLDAVDDTTFCLELGPEIAREKLRDHWESFITEEDFQWLAEKGINGVRIPVGHWLFGPPYPYHPKYGDVEHPYPEGGIEFLDRAFKWAARKGIHIQISLHAAPGGQNGWENNGMIGVMDWHTKPDYIEYSLDFVERLAARYKAEPALHSILVLNAPHWDIPTSILTDYTKRSYERIRNHCGSKDVAVVFHEGFRDASEYTEWLQHAGFRNTVYDIHRYQCFAPHECDRGALERIKHVTSEWSQDIRNLETQLGLPVSIGEWSLGFNGGDVAFFRDDFPETDPLEGMNASEREAAFNAFGSAQLLALRPSKHWFFRTYKTQNLPEWSLRDCVERGWLPSYFGTTGD